MFPRLEYLEWISGRPEVALYDLASSDLRGDRGHEPEAVPAPLENLDDPPRGATLETQIAGEYGVEPEQVLVTAGATMANVVAAATALDGGADEDAEENQRVLVEKPGYEPLVKTPAAFGAEIDRFLRGDVYRLDVERAANALTERTDLVTVTNRHNPSGSLAERETLADLAGVAGESDARLLVDEVYAPYVTEPRDAPFGGPTAAGLDDTVVTSSLTKFFGLDDLRIGWLVADREFVDHARSVAYHFHGVADTSRALGRRALHNLDHLAERSRTLLAENTELFEAFLAERDDVEGFLAEGATFAFLEPEHVAADKLVAAAWDEGLLIVPGRFFDADERVRVSLGRNPSEVAPALDALGAVLDRFQ
ncbi:MULTISPECIES: pyridoxal phosphate-dependent aminotransferase [Halobacterium]|uniref:pyridoxal phosphate-dependent aminotransferase n=1 Tax=Halobacterium TaxID=2239 RepID=UPI00073E1D56|nr:MULTISPECIES: pyridoxal phosphate-dependent aminotransferase [Halobacterium]MCG1002967.1 pyridoxal phosphate-dependent aminotransferase [Halobacterium noricense]